MTSDTTVVLGRFQQRGGVTVKTLRLLCKKYGVSLKGKKLSLFRRAKKIQNKAALLMTAVLRLNLYKAKHSSSRLYKNDVCPFSSERVMGKPYSIILSRYVFDVRSLATYIIREGDLRNPFTTVALSSENMRAIKKRLDRVNVGAICGYTGSYEELIDNPLPAWKASAKMSRIFTALEVQCYILLDDYVSGESGAKDELCFLLCQMHGLDGERSERELVLLIKQMIAKMPKAHGVPAGVLAKCLSLIKMFGHVRGRLSLAGIPEVDQAQEAYERESIALRRSHDEPSDSFLRSLLGDPDPDTL